MTYPLVAELAEAGIPVTVSCRVLKLARQPYYRIDYIRGWLALLANPRELYLNADDQMRRELNQAIFEHLWVLDENRVESELTEPAQLLIEAQRAWAREMHATIENSQASDESQAWLTSVETDATLTAINLVDGSSKRRLVDLRGLEPLTPCTLCARGWLLEISGQTAL
ncbi:MAG: hypothetical protein NT132_01790 [Microbacterium sp.]|uniref:hypothetical protein n=1 Tax=Microbacterium sp. TaxID=51671 RepID=UPI00260853B2|nr:hypothetical protein [Microbacterium sp.]MCX6501139.1 hypothetical protein [Microbacterium sp.]